MRIRRIEIERFRGVKALDWRVGGDIVCLIGPGDSTKTTILDAIEFALSPRWSIPFDDTDFHDADTAEPILITVTVGDLLEALLSEATYGYLARGWTAGGDLHDEPEEADEVVLTIQLRVDSTLEPEWRVVNDRNPEGKRISARDREKLGCARLGDYLDRHFSWGRGSILSRLTGEAESLSGILADAGRAARSALADEPPQSLRELRRAAGEAKRVGAQFGVDARWGFQPLLDVHAVSIGLGALSLHDGNVPLRRAGLASRRLLAVGMQRQVAKAGGLTLIDEVEHGLEPHRIRLLLRALRGPHDSPQDTRHVVMTTHAPIVLEELCATELRVVRCTNGVTQVLNVAGALQPVVRSTSEAFLARKVLVCEGKTEIGLCRRLDRRWSEDGPSFGLAGIALADGGGEKSPSVAKALAELGYEVALLGDSDRPLDPDRAALEEVGVKVFQWAGGVALEERVALDLPWMGVADVVNLAMNLWGEQPVKAAIASRASISANDLAGEPSDWLDLDIEEADLRAAIGQAARDHQTGNRRGWFKRVGLAEDLTGIVVEYLEQIADKNLARNIAALRAWSHGSG